MTAATKTTDELWAELCAAATGTGAASAPLAPAVHPFAKLGPAPYRFEGVDPKAEGAPAGKCALCGKSIRNLYIIADGEGALHTLGSECILGLSGNGFERHLVGAVKVAKRRFDKQKREAREAKKREQYRREVAEATERDFPKQAAWLRAYAGNFDFYLSLKSQLETNGGLSPRQWECVDRALEKEAARAAAPKVERVFSLAAGTVIIVTKFFAQIIGRDTGLSRPHFALEVLSVSAETEKAYRIRARLSAHRTAHCCVCGRILENHASVAAGIGPICAEKYGVVSVEALQAKLQTEYKAEIELWIPKSQIKERKVHA